MKLGAEPKRFIASSTALKPNGAFGIGVTGRARLARTFGLGGTISIFPRETLRLRKRASAKNRACNSCVLTDFRITAQN